MPFYNLTKTKNYGIIIAMMDVHLKGRGKIKVPKINKN